MPCPRCEYPGAVAVTISNNDLATHFYQKLSPRTCQLIAFIGQGLSNKEIAIKFKTTEQVVKNLARTAFVITGAESRLQLGLFHRDSPLLRQTCDNAMKLMGEK